MEKFFWRVLLPLTGLIILGCLPAYATNGDGLIGIGPISRAMGGVGVAAPQDAISAVFSNPAAICFTPTCPSAEFDFATTFFSPNVKTSVRNSSGLFKANSKKETYLIPAFGISAPLHSKVRLGLAAYGVSGMGVDYRDTAIDQPDFFGPNMPLVAGEKTELQVMKFAPTLAWQLNNRFSIGASLHLNYASLDLKHGTSTNYGFGTQVGLLAQLTSRLSFGLSYISPQKVNHANVADFNGDMNLDTLSLEAPQQFRAGLALRLSPRLLLEVDSRWINWENAEGYSDFDWEDQVVVAVGAQWRPLKSLTFRAGYNYGKNPLKKHNNFTGTEMVSVQGKSMPAYYYETFRLIGFPSIATHHLTLGFGLDISPSLALNCAYMHAFSETIKESGTDLSGSAVTLESTLKENVFDVGLSWRF